MANEMEVTKRRKALDLIRTMSAYADKTLAVQLDAADELNRWLDNGPGEDSHAKPTKVVFGDDRMLSIDKVPTETLNSVGTKLIKQVFEIQNTTQLWDPASMLKQALEEIWKDLGTGFAGE
jgi:hypothetical protein